jgi:hypothetical protein
MMIEFILRKPGGERNVFKIARMDAVPREGESVIIDDVTQLTVHSVEYDLRKSSPVVRVVLK